MKRSLFLLYGVFAYVVFLGSIFYAIGFTGNLVVPKGIDGPVRTSLPAALAINTLLLLLFVAQHTIMARPGFKRWWTKWVPAPVERSTFILVASLCLMLMMWQWQPMGGVIWEVRGMAGKGFLTFFFFLGWGLVFISTLLINHFDLFGLREVWKYYQEQPYEQVSFRTPLFYRFVRHPLYVGFLLAFWCTPVMSASHLFFAILTTAYLFTAVQFEERDISVFGEKYRQPGKQTPMILPFIKKKVS